MSAREALAACRTFLRTVMRVSPDETLKGHAETVLESVDAALGSPSPDALRKRKQRASGCHGMSVTVTDGHGRSRGGVGGDLPLDLKIQGDPEKNGEGESAREGEVSRTVTDSHTRMRTTRKRTATHCPGVDETPEAVDAWCRTQGIPPASESPQVRAMLLWHQANGQPQASWKARLRACAWGDRQTVSPRAPLGGMQPAPATGRLWKVGQ